MDVFLRLVKYVRPYWLRVTIGITCTLVIVCLEAVQPLLMRHVIDHVLTPYLL